MTDLSAPAVIVLAVIAALAVYGVVSWLMGPEETPWFPANHWHTPTRYPFPDHDAEPGDWRS